MILFNTLFKLLFFKFRRQDILNLDTTNLLFGILGTWLVGIGRYWDDNKASFVQHLGLGSVIYIFVLATFIWIIVLPLRIENWTYKIVLTFISLTSFPAILYAIPVERFFSIRTANSINVWFLAIVAIWRLILLFKFLHQFTQLSNGKILIITLMPITVIISTLTALNLHKVVFDIMRGIRNPTAHDSSYLILLFLTWISIILAVPLLLGYVYCIYARYQEIKRTKARTHNNSIAAIGADGIRNQNL